MRPVKAINCETSSIKSSRFETLSRVLKELLFSLELLKAVCVLMLHQTRSIHRSKDKEKLIMFSMLAFSKKKVSLHCSSRFSADERRRHGGMHQTCRKLHQNELTLTRNKAGKIKRVELIHPAKQPRNVTVSPRTSMTVWDVLCLASLPSVRCAGRKRR